MVLSGEGIFPLSGKMEILRDPGGQLKFEQIRALPSRSGGGPAFAPLRGGFSPGFSTDVFWLKFELARDPGAGRAWWLVATPPFIDDVRLYAPDGAGGFRESRAGDHVPVRERETAHRNTIFKLQLSEAPQTFFLRVESSTAVTLALSVASPERYGELASFENMFFGLFFGMLVIAVMISLLSSVWLRQRFFLVATAYLLAYGGLHFALNGFDQLFIYPDQPALADHVVGVLVCLATGFYLLFFLTYLDPQRRFPRLARAVSWGAWGSFWGAIASALGFYPAIAPLVAKAQLGEIVLVLGMSLGMRRLDPHRTALYLLMFGPGTAAVFLQILRNVGVLPATFLTTHLWEVTVIFQIPFTAVAVLMRARETHQAHLAAKSRALAAARRLEQELEQEVAARTAELARTNETLVQWGKELGEAKARAEELLAAEQARQRAQRRFIRTIAHELRTPLSVIEMAFTNIQTRTDPGHPELKPRYLRISRALTRLNSLVDNALAEDRLAESGIALQKEWIRPSALVRQVEQQLLLTERHRLDLRLPADDRPIYADPRWLTLAVLNLMDNAVKYSPEGGPVTLALAREGHEFRLRVEDRGIGIASELLPELFEKFFRAPEAVALSRSGGLGLGLYLVRQIIDLHGGEIMVESVPGQGSAFTIKIPGEAPARQREAAETQPDPVPAS